MKFDPVKGRLGAHRFHPMLVHFPSALYPFAFTMDLLAYLGEGPGFILAGMYALLGAVVTGWLAAIYGIIDFLEIDKNEKAWKVAGLHALLNVTWLTAFSVLLIFRIKHPDEMAGLIYLIISGTATSGMFVSNYLGGELVVRYKMGIQK